MQETDRPILEDPEQFRRVWQRVQGGRQEAALASEGEPTPAPRPWDPVPFLQDALVQCRMRGGCCRPWNRLSGLGQVYQGQARRIAAALFLLRGIRPVSRQGMQAPRWPSLEESCRQLFLWERRAEGSYQTALGQTADPDLRGLFQELARESAALQQRIRVILEEQMG